MACLLIVSNLHQNDSTIKYDMSLHVSFFALKQMLDTCFNLYQHDLLVVCVVTFKLQLCRLAICGCGNKLVVYSVKTGKLLRKLDGHETDVADYYFRVKNSLQVL